MPTIYHELFIGAPIALCFDLARDVDVHTRTVSRTKEMAVGGVTSGLLERYMRRFIIGRALELKRLAEGECVSR
ncbi:SRPBCC family protein [Aneurinibacillus sp. REN35]|uniref:hypothetical protein n=1 Tax=Aneurinibacillus sp. REN35 TaxID=3237286 RepID=UPI003529C785